MLKLLVVDDEPLILKAHQRGLGSDFQVQAVNNVEAARLLLHDIDVLLTDWCIGPETPEPLLKGFPGPTVIYTGSPHLVPTLFQGFVLTKPATYDEIIKALNNAVKFDREISESA